MALDAGFADVATDAAFVVALQFKALFFYELYLLLEHHDQFQRVICVSFI